MEKGRHFEIERKYLIRMPDEAFLDSQPGCVLWRIEQTYLTAPEGETRRIRRVEEQGQVRLYRTFKRRVSVLSAEEDEELLTPAEYEELLRQADPGLKTVVKKRYRIPWAGQMLEVDIFPFWTDRAVLEIELERESQPTSIPGWLTVIREVTGDMRYKNLRLAKQIPMEDIS